LGAILSVPRITTDVPSVSAKSSSYWFIVAALYALAKLFEFYDHTIYSIGSILSGHTFKHLAAAAACFAILKYFHMRRPIT
jgi:hypothetical protein